jgi:hypothetical protein
MGTDFDSGTETPAIALHGRGDGLREQDRLHQVLNPVRAVQFHFQRSFENVRIEPNTRIPPTLLISWRCLDSNPEVLQALQVWLSTGPHMMRVIRRVNLQHSGLHLPLIKDPLHLGDGITVSGQRHTGRRVARSNRNRALELLFRAKRSCCIRRHGNGHHGSSLPVRAFRKIRHTPPVVRYPHRVASGQQSGGIRSTDLTRGMPDDTAEADPAETEEVDEGDLDCGAEGL